MSDKQSIGVRVGLDGKNNHIRTLLGVAVSTHKRHQPYTHNELQYYDVIQ